MPSSSASPKLQDAKLEEPAAAFVGLAAAFNQLALANDWKPKQARYRKEKAGFYATEFSAIYGDDKDILENWQSLCEEVGIVPVPGSIRKCKKALQKVHVNIVDLIECRWKATGEKVKRFPSLAALRRYTVGDRVFPKAAAKNGGFLKALLRVLS